jgi:heavy metal efflux system protein
MNGLPGVMRVQSVSAFGLSQVGIYFRDDVDIYFARQLVFERVQSARGSIPPGLGEPALGAITTGLGQVYQYLVTGKNIPSDSLRTLQDWIVKFRLRTVAGVTDVLSFGGEVKQFQVQVDPGKLVQYGVTLPQVVQALERNNSNAGGSYIVVGAEEYVVRGLGPDHDVRRWQTSETSLSPSAKACRCTSATSAPWRLAQKSGAGRSRSTARVSAWPA